jgi:hypothetical protein
MNFCRCSMGGSNLRCIAWSEEVGSSRMGDCARPKSRVQDYRLTDKGRKKLPVEESQRKQMAEAVARVMRPAAEET